MLRREYVERSPAGPAAYCDFFKETFGLIVALYESLSNQSECAAEFDREFLEYATRGNRGAPGEPAEYPYAYLLVVARKR